MSKTRMFSVHHYGVSAILESFILMNSKTCLTKGDVILLNTIEGHNNYGSALDGMGAAEFLQFASNLNGHFCDRRIYKINNEGENRINLNLTFLNSFYFINFNNAYAVSKNSQFLNTTNIGMSCKNQFILSIPRESYSVRFFNKNTGLILDGRMPLPYFSLIYETTNCDESWIQHEIVNRDINSVLFSNSNTSHAVGEQGIIFKTTNDSILCNTQVYISNHDHYTVCYNRERISFTGGVSSDVQKSANVSLSGVFAISGKVLKPDGQPITSGYVKALKYNIKTDAIQVLDSAAIQSNGDYILPNLPVDTVDIMAYPNDTEENINPPLFVPTYYTGTDIGTIYWRDSRKLFVNKNLFEINITVLLTSGIGGIQTIGGGVFSAPPNLNALRGAIVYAMVGNEFRGFGISRTNGIYAANFLAPGTYTMICDRMGYRDAQRSVILGNFNIDTINFYLTHINLIGIKANTDKIPFSYELGQNYPNPFNPNTKFTVDIPYESDVNINIYDMLGREVEILFDSRLKPGSYIFDWDASAYSSGIYFYRITASARNNPGYRFTDVKKMILMK